MRTPAARIASSSASEPVVLLSQCHSGWAMDSPAAMSPAKCSTASKPASGVSTCADVVHPRLDELGLGGHLRGVVAGQVVEHDHLVAGVEQQPRHDAADVTGAAGDQKLHGSELSFPHNWTQSNNYERPIIR